MKTKQQNMHQFHNRLQAQDKDPLFAALRQLTKSRNPKAFTDKPTPLGTWAGWPMV